MTIDSANLENNAVLFTVTANDDIQFIQQDINVVIGQLKLAQTTDQLYSHLTPEQSQTLIVIDNLGLPDLQHIKTDLCTMILVVQADNQEINRPPFDFILRYDDTFLSLLQQILQFKQQQVELNNSLLSHIHKLEKQLTTQKQQTTQVEVLKEAIVRNVSHELKTPLLHVKSAVSLLSEDVGKDNKLIRYAENATARLETLVTNITMFGSSLDLKLGPVIVRDAVAYSHRSLSRIWESKEDAKRIKLHIDTDLPPVLADRQGISTILQLLLDNALKFSDGDIEVHAHQVGGSVEISVRDYGIGIAPKDLKNIFDSFYQIDPSSTRRYGGTGVGLALVKLLIENHQSEIQVTSELNKGSTFSFQLKIIDFQ